jgi:flagellar basal body-associated protein FliL
MKKKKRIVYNLCLAVLICIFLGSAGYLAYYFLQSKKSEDQFQKLEAMVTPCAPTQSRRRTKLLR